MPFSLDENKHIFRKNNKGGIQLVYAVNKNDIKEINEVRIHLGTLAMQLAKQDYSMPVLIHGKESIPIELLKAQLNKNYL